MTMLKVIEVLAQSEKSWEDAVTCAPIFLQLAQSPWG